MLCLESVMLLSVINNQFPSFLQQNQYLILALYHYNVLNYFVQLLGSQICTPCLLSLMEIQHKETQ